MANDGTIMLTAEDGSEDAFFVWEKADIAGRQYLLVSNVDPAQEENEEADDEEIFIDLARGTRKKMTAYCMIL